MSHEKSDRLGAEARSQPAGGAAALPAGPGVPMGSAESPGATDGAPILRASNLDGSPVPGQMWDDDPQDADEPVTAPPPPPPAYVLTPPLALEPLAGAIASSWMPSGRRPRRPVIVVAAGIALALAAAGMVVARGGAPPIASLPSPSLGSPGTTAGATDPITGNASPGADPSASAGPQASIGPRIAIEERLRTIVMSPTFSGRIAVSGTMRIASVKAALEGNVEFSGTAFASHYQVRSSVVKLRQDTWLVYVRGSIYQKVDGSWTTVAGATTLASDVFRDLRSGHRLVDMGPVAGSNGSLRRIRWPDGAALLSAPLQQDRGSSWRVTRSRVDAIVTPTGIPVRVEAELRGTLVVGGRRVAMSIVVTFRYTDVGAPITIWAPTT